MLKRLSVLICARVSLFYIQINIAVNCSRVQKLLAERRDLRALLRDGGSELRMAACRQQLNNVDVEVRRWVAEPTARDSTRGSAFVSFARPADAATFLARWHGSHGVAADRLRSSANAVDHRRALLLHADQGRDDDDDDDGRSLSSVARAPAQELALPSAPCTDAHRSMACLRQLRVNEWRASPAPSPGNVIWSNLGVGRAAYVLRLVLVNVLVLLFCSFLTTPAAIW